MDVGKRAMSFSRLGKFGFKKGDFGTRLLEVLKEAVVLVGHNTSIRFDIYLRS